MAQWKGSLSHQWECLGGRKMGWCACWGLEACLDPGALLALCGLMAVPSLPTQPLPGSSQKADMSCYRLSLKVPRTISAKWDAWLRMAAGQAYLLQKLLHLMSLTVSGGENIAKDSCFNSSCRIDSTTFTSGHFFFFVQLKLHLVFTFCCCQKQYQGVLLNILLIVYRK